ncbi:ATP-binding protein [Rhodoplanes roseus]|uniref:ATPase n=1 Tax=Rhodoplanes roseus TaxID=29409 RepID=A0A327L3E7_9BRAD|nr:ATP-binding protein [Rhodoplanes roseus]RAI44343.1 ATPase [Rhodoplanes roseus]
MTSILSDPTYLGVVAAVTGASVTVKLADSVSSGLAIIGGHTYRVGQVGSFVRVPQGYQDLFGVVSEVGADAAPEAQVDSKSTRWMRVELAGEAIGSHFERGLSQHPNINDTVHIVTEDDLSRIYGENGNGEVPIGSLSSAENITVKVSLDALVTRHSAILGSTGSGKSTTVASIIRSMVAPTDQQVGSPGARILLLDVHGEYCSALADLARVYSTAPQSEEHALVVPFWALEAGEILEFIAGNLSENHSIAFLDKIQELKEENVRKRGFPGLDPNSLTVDSPVPFSLKRLWYELIDFELTTFVGPQRNVPAREAEGDANALSPPRYTPHSMGNAGPYLNTAAKGIKRQLNLVRSRLLDKRYDFILHPGVYEPDVDGGTGGDLDCLLEGWLGHDRPITILDLSGVPSAVLERLIGSILRIMYEALYWSREKTEGGVLRPLLVVMEEAHRYLNDSGSNVALDMVKRIAKEGRKYGVGAMIVSQRPAEINETVLSQCGTVMALRLSNPVDRARVKGALPDNLSGLMDLLPVLRTGEAVITGEAARLPVRCRVKLPREEHQPRSRDPRVKESWSVRRKSENYGRVVASWRAQKTTAVSVPLEIKRESVPPEEA